MRTRVEPELQVRTMDINFQQELHTLRESLRSARRDLEMLEAEYRAHQVETTRAHDALTRLRETLGLGAPGTPTAGADIDALDVSEASGRPARGARRAQVEAICRKLGRHGLFRTAEVVRELEAIEDAVSSGLRSYTYAVMNHLEDEGLVLKQGRGTWLLSEDA